MKKQFINTTSLLIALLAVASVCEAKRYPSIIPTAMSTVNSVTLEELNLKHGTDYTILNTVSVDGIVVVRSSRNDITVKEVNGEFTIEYSYDSDGDCEITCDGIARFGFLNNDYENATLSRNPMHVARNLAIYRLINASKVAGADGIIEPVISTNVEQSGRDIIFKTTASAKLIRIVADK